MSVGVESLEQNIMLLQQRAQDGDILAQIQLADCFRKGRGVKRNMEEALQWLKKAGEQKSPEALYQLGRCAEDGNGMPRDEKVAVDYYRQAAEKGHMEAQYAYAICKQAGIGCTQDLQDSLYWMEKAANQGHENAHLQLGRLHDECARLQQIQEQQQVKTATENQQKEVASANPVPYHMPSKNMTVIEDRQEKKLEPPAAEKATERNSIPFIVIYALCGMFLGVFIYNLYPNMPNVGQYGSASGYIFVIGLVSTLLGTGMGFLLHYFYKKAAEPLPLFGPLLLLPLLIFLVGGAISTLLIFVVSLLLKILAVIFVIVIVGAIIGAFLGG